MELLLNEKEQVDKFAYLIKNIKNITNDTTIKFAPHAIYSQGINNDKTCLYEFKIGKLWFNDYKYISQEPCIEIGINTIILSKIFNTLSTNQSIKIIYDENNCDYLSIEFCNIDKENKTSFNKYFQLPLMDLNYQTMSMPDNDPDVSFEIDCNKLNNICSQTKVFHNVINIKCNENNIKFKINGIETKFTIKLDLDDVNEYVIVENLTFDEKYDLNMFNTISSFSKLSNVVALELDTNNPMIIHYKITPENDGDAENDENDENDKFILTFYLVAKTNNDDDDINSDQASDNNSDVDENDYH